MAWGVTLQLGVPAKVGITTGEGTGNREQEWLLPPVLLKSLGQCARRPLLLFPAPWALS